MHEKKNQWLLIFLVVLILCTVVVYWFVRPSNKMDIDHRIFQAQDYKSIDKIYLDSDTVRITLDFNGTRWRVNNKYDADGTMINVLFATLQQARPKRSVGIGQKDSVYQQITKTGIKVSLLEGNAVRKEFIAGGNTAKTQAYFAEPSTLDVYVMSIPGYRVYVSGIFEMKESGWRDKTVFSFNWRNFKSMEARFQPSSAENFIVSLNNGFFGIQGMDTDTVKLNAFFDNLFALSVDEFIHDNGVKDSIGRMPHVADFTVTDVANRTYRLKLFTKDGQTRVMGLIQDSQLAIFDRRKIQPLLRTKSFFRKK